MTEERAISMAFRCRNRGQHRNVYSFVCSGCGIIQFVNWWHSGGYCTKQCAARNNGSRIAKRGQESHAWKGGRRVNGGYVYLCGHGEWRGYRAEHAVVIEAAIGRRLLPGESVHHKNGIKTDNRLENLELWSSRSQPSGQRVIDVLRFVADKYEAEIRSILECKDIARRAAVNA